MNINDLKTAGDFARNYGVKALIYGPAGTGKTPLINTCPRPLMLITEPGVLSMRGSTVPAYEANTEDKIDDFFKWFFNSTETKNFDTLAVDSTFGVADIYLKAGEKKSGHGLAQYGHMSKKTMDHLRNLYFMQHKHTYLIAREREVNGLKQPYWPGNDLPTQIPYLYDAILRLAKVQIQGVGERLAFQCNGSANVVARNRTGNLFDFEEPDFGKLVTKAMQT